MYLLIMDKTNQLALSDFLIWLVFTLGFNEELKAKTNHIKESPN